MVQSDLMEKINQIAGLKAFVGDDPELKIELIPFCIPQLDRSIGGGIPKGRIIELIGDFSTGKSYLTLKLIQSAQDIGLVTVLFDTEAKFDPSWAKSAGVRLDKLIVVKGNILENIFDALFELVKTNVGLAIVDGLAALITLFESEESMAQKQMGMQAKAFSEGFKKILVPLATSKTALVFTNQERSGIGAFARDFSPGGRAQNFYSVIQIQVRRGEWKTERKGDKDVRVGFMIETRAVKNQMAPPWQTASIPFYFTGKVDLVASVCQLGLDCGIIRKSGGWFNFDSTKAQGWDNFVDLFKKDNDLIKQLHTALLEVD